jgi:hypothetical protein
MPVDLLYVEGNLEVEVLYPILLGAPTVKKGGSKGSLRPRATTERNENRVRAGYLRDRDFDYDPPADLTTATIDHTVAGQTVGWRWCRHETENYLIEPRVVTQATGLSQADYETALKAAAASIHDYEAARWTVGRVRRSLPPLHDLTTRPAGLNELDLPPHLDEASVRAWAESSITSFRAPLIAASDPAAVGASFQQFQNLFDPAFLAQVNQILVYFSGKDLLAGLKTWLDVNGFHHPSEFRMTLRDWAIVHPAEMMAIHPEWNALPGVLRA